MSTLFSLLNAWLEGPQRVGEAVPLPPGVVTGLAPIRLLKLHVSLHTQRPSPQGTLLARTLESFGVTSRTFPLACSPKEAFLGQRVGP